MPRHHPFLAAFLFLVVAVVLVWTTPHRWGVGTALHYVSRAYSKDPDDPIPGRETSSGRDPDDANRY